MFEWKVEEMKLMDETKTYINGKRIYNAEDITSREDKIAFVDSKTDGKLSYILGLIEKFNVDKENLPKQESWYNEEPPVKTVSLKAWIKRNDTKYDHPIIDTGYHYGEFNILGCERYIQSNGMGFYDIYRDLVDECFHRLLCACERKEFKYFEEHDDYTILKNKVIEKMHIYGRLETETIITSKQELLVGDFENNRKITMGELKDLKSKYYQIDALIEKLTEETDIKY